MATKGSRWVLTRCTDLVPSLIRMAAAEWWYGPTPDETTVEAPVVVA
jgi:hypothetical protein